ncbi:WD repeat-containing protein 46-like [Bradysia coprophila]|uniref:WD repeat-containing protein 46-like n=1 Tax=Bradysia coprophila TaxID=38358 RepID=UPI00187D870D|nr:WD repeat-containing protein 46-like [Bradysia coprophila]
MSQDNDDMASSSNRDFVGNKIKFEDSKFSGTIVETDSKSKPFRQKKIKREKFKIDPEALKRHSRGPAANETGVKTNLFKKKLKQKEIYLQFSNEQAARTEILRNEEEGFIEADEGESTIEYTQSQIVQNVDITSAAKHFSLNLGFGPYRMKYTKNGRHLLIGGRKGHVAAFDWITKRLHCEMNVTEEVVDVAWLHIETMFAVAQKSWVHFYDNQGTELHCVKQMNSVNRLEFLPHHFLLASGNEVGFLSWLDTSIGEMVSEYNTRLGPVRLMTTNPTNGVLCLGGSKGVVSMWSPSTREPLAKLLCHPTPLSSIAVDPKGTYMATCGLDKSVKIWDIRALSGPTIEYKIRLPAQHMSISQKGLLGLAMGNVCEVHKKPNLISPTHAYIMQKCDDFIHGMEFCPYEDVLGVTTRKGFQSLLVPGSGEANFDALEANPFQTKSQRRENEVHALLDKIPPEFIALDPAAIVRVDVPTFKEKVEAKKNLLYLKPPKIDFKRAKKMKGKGGSANTAKVKQIVKNAKKKEFVKDIKGIKEKIFNEHKLKSSESSADQPKHVLDRFKSKKKI